eukprot:3029872-Prymnesium_polylepis.1
MKCPKSEEFFGINTPHYAVNEKMSMEICTAEPKTLATRVRVTCGSTFARCTQLSHREGTRTAALTFRSQSARALQPAHVLRM